MLHRRRGGRRGLLLGRHQQLRLGAQWDFCVLRKKNLKISFFMLFSFLQFDESEIVSKSKSVVQSLTYLPCHETEGAPARPFTRFDRPQNWQ